MLYITAIMAVCNIIYLEAKIKVDYKEKPIPYEWLAIIHNAECIAKENISKCSGQIELEDVIQELLLSSLAALDSYNHLKASKLTFFDRVMRFRMKNIIRHCNRKKYLMKTTI